MDVEKDDFEWTPFNNDQINFRNELLQLASKNIPNAYEDRVYKGSNFLGFRQRNERMNYKRSNYKRLNYKRLNNNEN